MKLVANVNTVLKKEPVQSSVLPADKKVIQLKDSYILVDEVRIGQNGHSRVVLKHGAGTWFIFDKHWATPVQPRLCKDIPEAAIALITKWEGFVPHPYNDGVGVPTIGLGTTRYPSGRYVTYDDPMITLEQAQEFLEHYLLGVRDVLSKDIPGWKDMTDNQRSALYSFAYNLGEYFYGESGFASITRALSSPANWSDVPRVLELYSMPGTNVYEGLIARRREEGELWNL